MNMACRCGRHNRCAVDMIGAKDLSDVIFALSHTVLVRFGYYLTQTWPIALLGVRTLCVRHISTSGFVKDSLLIKAGRVGLIL